MVVVFLLCKIHNLLCINPQEQSDTQYTADCHAIPYHTNYLYELEMNFIIWLLSIHLHWSAIKEIIRGDNHGLLFIDSSKGLIWQQILTVWLLLIHSHLSASKDMIRGDNHELLFISCAKVLI